MAMQEVIEKTLVWLYNKHKENHTEMWNISQYVKSLGLSTTSENIGLELANRGYLSTYYNFRSTDTFNAAISFAGMQQVAPAEAMALTLKVLAHLKTSKSEYFDLDTVPALKNQDWNQICDLAKFLLKKKFVMVQGVDTNIFARITQAGLQYLHACEATAC